MKLVNVRGTMYLRGDKGAVGFADEASYQQIQVLDSAEPERMDALDVPVVKIMERGFTIHN